MILHCDSTKLTSAWWAAWCNVPKCTASLFTRTEQTCKGKQTWRLVCGLSCRAAAKYESKNWKRTGADTLWGWRSSRSAMLWYGTKWSKVNMAFAILQFTRLHLHPFDSEMVCLFGRKLPRCRVLLPVYCGSIAKTIKTGFEINSLIIDRLQAIKWHESCWFCREWLTFSARS